MLISVNWLRDFVDIPANIDIHELAERFTMTCAEVEGVEHINVGGKGLIAAKIVSFSEIPDSRNLRQVTLDVGGKTITTVSAAPVLRENELVVFAPVGSRTNRTGDIGVGNVSGIASEGMILCGEDIGIAMSADEAIFCPPSTKPGEAIPEDILDDWVIEVDNKSITHRPDLWGHYGIAREISAMLKLPLREYPVVDVDELTDKSKPKIPIKIGNPEICYRYSALRMDGVKAQAAPLLIQTRLGHIGMRPIDCLVDLSNYIMAELGQPTHAFDGDKLTGIEVEIAADGEKFTTLDGIERSLPKDALMIQCEGRSVALAGIMGGLETEVSEQTQSILLESANFEAACIRRCAASLGLRTDASARFEKSLDPNNTVLAIQRFILMARAEFPELGISSRLSDCYPNPPQPIAIEVDPEFVNRFMGHPVSVDDMVSILTAIEFDVRKVDEKLKITVPSFRATKDISIEADIIEEIARYVGYDNFDPTLPVVTVRHLDANQQHRLERNSLELFCMGLGYSEIHLYVWYDQAWLKQLDIVMPESIELRNPAAAGQEFFRHTLLPGLLQATERNRLHADSFKLAEIGTVFPGDANSKTQERRLGLISAQHGKKCEDTLLEELKGELDTWAWQTFSLPVSFTAVESSELPVWAHEHKTAAVVIGGKKVGLVSAAPLGIRRKMDEHLSTWGIAWAELELEQLCGLEGDEIQLAAVPEFPEVELDFSILVDTTTPFGQVNDKLGEFDNDLLRRITFVAAYEGKSVPDGKRSLTYRMRIGCADRTLVEDDLTGFRKCFEEFVTGQGFQLR